MGMHDRDYYREDYAEKNGLRYDRKRGVYTALVKAPPPDDELPLSTRIGICVAIVAALALVSWLIVR